ncbi:MAG: 30S ribosome-binding factor RbfA, partial [Deltaproteobacteria bacterium]|jgi:hypothetical protein|nr:30S ribosome-binding factor RbfA [Deltaproteobacteria bacterium]
VFFSVLGGEDKRENAVAALGKATGFVRSFLAAELKLKYTPKIIFVYDHNLDHAEHVNEILNRLKQAEPSAELSADRAATPETEMAAEDLTRPLSEAKVEREKTDEREGKDGNEEIEESEDKQEQEEEDGEEEDDGDDGEDEDGEDDGEEEEEDEDDDEFE